MSSEHFTTVSIWDPRYRGVANVVVLAVFVVANFVFAIATRDRIDSLPLMLVAATLVGVGAVLVTHPGEDPLRIDLTWAVIGIVGIASVIAANQLPEDGPVLREGWIFGACTWLLFFLPLRRRPWHALIGFVVLTLAVASWTTATGRGPMEILMTMDVHAAWLVIAALFGRYLHSAQNSIEELEERLLSTEANTSAQEARSAVRGVRQRDLSGATLPLLNRIAEGEKLTANLMLECAVVEASLRDSVRARSLAVGGIPDATSDARLRGVEVTLLDDRGETIPDDIWESLVSDIVNEITGAEAGHTLTIRLLPLGRTEVLTMVRVTEDEQIRRSYDVRGQRRTHRSARA